MLVLPSIGVLSLPYPRDQQITCKIDFTIQVQLTWVTQTQGVKYLCHFFSSLQIVKNDNLLEMSTIDITLGIHYMVSMIQTNIFTIQLLYN